MAAHADAHDADFGDIRVGNQLLIVDDAIGLGIGHGLLGPRHLIGGAGPGHVGAALFGDVLNDHVDVHARIAEAAKDGGGDARAVGHADQRHLGFVTGKGDPGHYIAFHDVLLGTDQRACIVTLFFETRQDAQAHVVAHGQLDRAGLQDLGAKRGKLQHLLKSDLVQLAGLGRNAWIGGIDAVHIRIDIATLRLECRGEGHGGGVAATSAQGRDAAFGAHTLKACDNGHAHAFGKFCGDIVGGDLFDAGAGMGRGRFDRHLPALPTAGRHVHFLQGEGHKASRDVLARGHNRVIFASVIHRRGLIHPTNQFIGLARHGRHDDDHVIALGHFHTHAFRSAADTVEGGYGCATKFHHQNRHARLTSKSGVAIRRPRVKHKTLPVQQACSCMTSAAWRAKIFAKILRPNGKGHRFQ
mmetsp:Transcript_23169/g.39620  ORF Transcript_23169/g.39620 Transcript_23169/m.39620 type:complete len:413 (-) Transcript_23169:1642-2880(-)